jgi:hypothetical protein
MYTSSTRYPSIHPGVIFSSYRVDLIGQSKKMAGSDLAAQPYLNVLYLRCTPVSFPLAAPWWSSTIILEQSLHIKANNAQL